MTVLSERLALLVSLNPAGAVKGLETIGKAADRNLGRAQSKLDQTGQRLQKFGVGALAAGGIVASGLWKAGQAASDLGEVMSKNTVVFQDASGEVEAFAENAAKIGLSKRAALEAATGFGNLFVSMGLATDKSADMSLELSGLASDLASFNNTSTDDAIVALGAALRGESEPIRRYGVLLDDATLKAKALEMGLISTTKGTLPPAIRAQAAYAVILAQTTTAQGDFARTADGAANKQRVLKAEMENLKAEVGQGVLPVMTKLLTVATDLTGGLARLDAVSGGAVGTFATWGTVGLTAAGGLSFLAGKAIVLRNSIKDLPGRMKEITGGLSGVKGTMVKAGAAVTAAAVAWGLYKDMMADAAAEGRAAADGIRSAFDDIAPDTMSMEKLRSIIAGMDGDIADMSATLDGSSAPWDADFRAEVKASIGAGSELRAEWKKLETAAGELADEMGISEDAALRQILTNEDLKGSIDPVTGAFDEEAGAATAAAQALKELNDELNAMFDPLFAAEDAMLDLADAQAAVTEAEKEHGRNSAEAQAARRDAIRSTLDYEQALIDLKAGIEDESVSVEDATATLNAWAWQGMITKQAADEAAWSFGVLAGKADDLDGQNVVIRATADTADAESALDRLISRLGTIAGSSVYQRGLGSLYGIYQPDAPSSRTPQANRTPVRAHGGPVTQGSTYMVGERGPELFTAAASGSIIPTNRLGAGGVTNVFYISALDPASTARAVKDAVRAGSVRGVA